MALFMDIGQGAGLSGASGVRPFIPTLLAGALARDNAGLDFEGTDYGFLENQWFLLAILCLAVAVYAANRRVETAPELNRGWTVPDVLEKVAAVLGIVLGGLLFAGSLADHGYTSWWGIPAGILCGALGYLAVALLFDRAKRRVGRAPGTTGARSLLDAYADGLSLALAGLSIAVPPAGYVALVAFVVLIVRSRGEEARKYGGLRILR
jgi:hypothetical protein